MNSKSEMNLGSVCDVISGYAFKSAEFVQKGVPLIRISNISDNEVIPDEDINMPSEYSTQYSKFLIKKGDILIALSGATTGKYGIYRSEREVLLNQRVGLLRPNDDKIIKNYLFHYLNLLQNTILTNAQGAAQPNISTNEIASLKIPTPPLLAQKRIAEILDKADALRKKDKQLLQYYDDLAQSLFIEMFGDPIINEKSWTISKLSSVCNKITDGTHQGPKFLKDGIPFLLVSNIKNNKIDYNTEKFISPGDFEILNKRTPIEIGNILITTVGSYGNPAIIEKETQFAFQRHIAFLKPEHSLINYIFLFSVLKTEFVKRQIDEKVIGVAQKTLNLSSLKDIQIIYPSIELQNQFAKQIQNIEQQKEKLKAQMQESENLFQSLLQKAFSSGLN